VTCDSLAPAGTQARAGRDGWNRPVPSRPLPPGSARRRSANGALFIRVKNQFFHGLIFSPDGQYLAFSKDVNNSNVWLLENF